MVTHKTPPLILATLFFSACAVTEVPLAHDNPLDRIYDSGKFRLVLTGEAKSANLTQLSWSNVYHSEDRELNAENLKLNPDASILRSATAPSATDIAAVKNGSALSGAFSAVSECVVSAKDSSYAGSCNVTSAPTKGYFIIRFNYRYTKSDTTTGILYSNFEVVQ